MAPPATISAAEESGALVWRATGDWVVASAGALDRRLHALALPERRQVRLDLAGLARLDTAGAWLLLRTEQALAARGNDVALTNIRPSFAPLLAQLRAHHAAAAASPQPMLPLPPRQTAADLVAGIGEMTIALLRRLYSILGFGGLVVLTVAATLRRPRRLRGTALVVQMQRVGLDAMPIVGLLSFLIGIVLAYQGADQLRQFGAQIYTVNLLGIAVLRELGVLLAAIIIAGRSGSAFTAQIGTMQVNQEIDALRTLGLDPVEVLVLPRVFGLVLTLPLLVFYADAMGLVGGGAMVRLTLGISVSAFLDQLRDAITQWTLWVGVIKAPFFAAIISMVGCYEGFSVTGSAESVGRLTTRSVVEAIFLVIVADAAFSILFSVLGV